MKFSAAISSFSTVATIASAFTPSAQIRISETALFARKPFISGNWKLNPQTKDEAIELATGIAGAITPSSPDADVALFVPSVYLESVSNAVDGKFVVGAESVCPEAKGAYTGAISSNMIKSIGIEWSLAGHSERRVIYKESDEYINAQVLKLLEDGMSVMLCIGESEDEYDKNLVESVCSIQLKKGLASVTKEQMSRVAIAYEPVWAIGTGKVATPETAQSVHEKCRAILTEMFDAEIGGETRILYGGSVSPDSIDQLMAKEDVDGVLVGGASLDSGKFSRIINFEPVTAMA